MSFLTVCLLLLLLTLINYSGKQFSLSCERAVFPLTRMSSEQLVKIINLHMNRFEKLTAIMTKHLNMPVFFDAVSYSGISMWKFLLWMSLVTISFYLNYFVNFMTLKKYAKRKIENIHDLCEVNIWILRGTYQNIYF